MTSSSSKPLTDVQLEILKTFSVDLSDSDLQDLKKNIAKFLLDKIRKEADLEWDNRGYNESTVKKWLDEE